MRRRRVNNWARGRGDNAGHTNVTPLIDVVMCLIVFYLIVGRLADDSGATRLRPPETSEGERSAVPRLVLSVAPFPRGEGVRVQIEGKDVEPGELPETISRLVGEKPAAEVGVRADRRLSWGQVRPVVDACRAAGVGTVKLITERAGVGGAP